MTFPTSPLWLAPSLQPPPPPPPPPLLCPSYPVCLHTKHPWVHFVPPPKTLPLFYPYHTPWPSFPSPTITTCLWKSWKSFLHPLTYPVLLEDITSPHVGLALSVVSSHVAGTPPGDKLDKFHNNDDAYAKYIPYSAESSPCAWVLHRELYGASGRSILPLDFHHLSSVLLLPRWVQRRGRSEEQAGRSSTWTRRNGWSRDDRGAGDGNEDYRWQTAD